MTQGIKNYQYDHNSGLLLQEFRGQKTVKVQFQSDMHHEFMTHHDPPDIVDAGANVIVLAGDIDTGTKGVHLAIGQAEKLARPIIYVAGNHEFYGQKFPRLIDKSRAGAEGSGVHFLEQQGVNLYGYHFLWLHPVD